MPKQIVIAEQYRIAAVFSEDQIQEMVVATGSHQVSDIYLGTVENVLQGIDAAFVNIGDPERNGFIHVTDLGPLRLKRSSGSITELLAPQQKVLVQIMKEPTGTKGPRLTGNISLPGRYLVLIPYGRGVNLSRRIRSENERNRLRALAVLIKPSGMGLLVRTEAENTSEDAILEDLETLQKQWELVQQEASSTRAPALLNRDDDFIQRVLRDMYSADVNRIVVDSSNSIKRVKQHLTVWNGGKLPPSVLVDHHQGTTKDGRSSILEFFRINAAIKDALKPRVDLPSGGYVIIEPTEALTVIDVNSGSFTRSATARETVLWTNCEAATEIARQLRLRNIAGVIIVDFIDMESRRDQLQVLEHFNKVLRADKARPQIAQLSELGLVELTRKRQGQNIYELFGQTCPHCSGLGLISMLPGESEWQVNTDQAGAMRADRAALNLSRNLANLSDPGLIGGIVSATPAVRDERLSEPGRYRETSAARYRTPPDPYGDKRESGYDSAAALRSDSAGTLRSDRTYRADSGIPPATISARSAAQAPQIPIATQRASAIARERVLWENANDDLDLEGDSNRSSLELLNHPSYQELSPPHHHQRRRRRLDDIPLRDEEARTSRIPGSPLPERSGELRPNDPLAAVSPLGLGYSGRETMRGRPGRLGMPNSGFTSDLRSMVEPPEVITVEMEKEAQEVYAFAGISPLVFIDHPVKNPRGVLVSVTTPGQESTIDPAVLIREEMEVKSRRSASFDPPLTNRTRDFAPPLTARNRDFEADMISDEGNFDSSLTSEASEVNEWATEVMLESELINDEEEYIDNVGDQIVSSDNNTEETDVIISSENEYVIIVDDDSSATRRRRRRSSAT